MNYNVSPEREKTHKDIVEWAKKEFPDLADVSAATLPGDLSSGFVNYNEAGTAMTFPVRKVKDGWTKVGDPAPLGRPR